MAGQGLLRRLDHLRRRRHRCHRARDRPRARPHRPRDPGRRDPRGQAGGGRAAGLGRHDAHRAVRDPSPGGRHLAGQRGRDRGLGDQGERQDRRRRGLRDPQLHPGDLRGGHAARPALRRAAAERAAPAELRRAGTGRRGRRDLAVQLPADPGRPLGRPGARARQRGGAQAGPAHLGLRRRGARPGLRGGRTAREPAARAARPWPTRPRISRSATRPPARSRSARLSTSGSGTRCTRW
jgi:hypothetical protein